MTTDWQNQLQEAEKQFDQKQFEKADRLAREVLRVQPNSARALQVVGLVHSDLTISTPKERSSTRPPSCSISI